MIFNSFAFFGFFIILAVLYGFVKESQRWCILLAGSLIFYMSSGWTGLLYILATSVSTFFAALGIDRLRTDSGLSALKFKKILFAACIIFNFGILGIVKYLNFFFDGMAYFSGVSYCHISFVIPLGISFYTFQTMGYLIDAYNGNEIQKNYLKLLLFTCYFPQIINGPISRYHDISEKLFHPLKIEYKRCRDALLLFSYGLFKKICVADNIKIVVDQIYGNYERYHGILILSGAVAYAIYIYADFSGCIDMARGISLYFGVDLKENFKRPYFARSIEEFWRRWHITLSGWFKDYLFYPLQMSKSIRRIGDNLLRKGYKKSSKIVPTCIALMIVWFTTGLWHGANLTYIVWGLYYGIFMIGAYIVRTFSGKRKHRNLKESRAVICAKTGITFFIVCVGYLFFNAPDLQAAFCMIYNLFSVSRFVEMSSVYSVGVTFFRNVGGIFYFTVTVISTVILFAHDFLEEIGRKPSIFKDGRSYVLKYIGSVMVVFLLLFMMNRSSGDFTYMQF